MEPLGDLTCSKGKQWWLTLVLPLYLLLRCVKWSSCVCDCVFGSILRLLWDFLVYFGHIPLIYLSLCDLKKEKNSMKTGRWAVYLNCSPLNLGETKKKFNKIIIDTNKIDKYEIPEDLMRQMRSSVILAGALLGKHRKAIFSYPGDCDIWLIHRTSLR